MSPGFVPWIAPSVPRITASTSLESVTMLTMISDAAATSLGEAAAFAPASTRGSIFEAVLFQTVTGNPAFTRFMDIPPPMRPSPMNPILFKCYTGE
jgi:hypothetical protein